MTGDWVMIENITVTILDLYTSLVEFLIPASSINAHSNVTIIFMNSAGVTQHSFTMSKSVPILYVENRFKIIT